MISPIPWRVGDREYTKVKTLFTIAMQQLGKEPMLLHRETFRQHDVYKKP